MISRTRLDRLDRLARGPLAHAMLRWLILAVAMAPVSGALSVYLEPEQLTARAPVVVEGTVVRTAAGFDPERRTLATYVSLRVETVHRGAHDLEQVVLREPGGQFGDWVHVLDAVPVYSLGERVLVFLEPAPDGALRTAAMFFGKFSLSADSSGQEWAERDLGGAGLIFRRSRPRSERFPLDDLRATVASVPYHTPYDASARPARRASERSARGGPGRDATRLPPSFLASPPELDRLLWDRVRQAGSATGLDPSYDHATLQQRFVPLSPTAPSRWFDSDSGTPVSIEIDPRNNPLGDDAAAVAEMQRAMLSWTEVPEARVQLVAGSTDYDYRVRHDASPAASYSGTNVILFDDPFHDISDPINCAGVLAIGGYWRTSGIGGTINGLAFHNSVQLYVIFNDKFECMLSDPDNLAEVGTHELGHGLGFGHSTAFDAIMRSTAHGNRGPRLGDDDRDAAHCFYPHTLSVVAPDGGEVWSGGGTQSILWNTTAEPGTDEGLVTLEYSLDDGQSWLELATDVANDGSHTWIVPATATAQARVRVMRYNRLGDAPAPFPDACSSDASNGSFSIVVPVPSAGSVPNGSGSTFGLAMARGPGDQLRLSWDPSCSAQADDYAVYEGDLAALRGGSWDSSPLTCSTAGALSTYFSPGAGDRFYLVTPLAGEIEGHYGRSSSGTVRPASPAACAARESAPVCEYP